MVVTPQSENVDFKAGTVLLIDKPFDWTSFDVVNKVRYALKPFTGKIKVGHAGTLDPKATGLLILCTGKMTKSIEQFTAQHKSYTGTFVLGATTPSFDSEEEIDHKFPIEHLTEQLIKEAAKTFIGSTPQIPPMFSAIKKDGVPLYLKARRGEMVEIEPRIVEISRFDITKTEMPNVHFHIECSKGTYIRSIARDFGKALNSGGYLGSLIRTKIGDFDLNNAWQLDDLINFIKFTASQSKADEGFQRP